LTFLTSKTINPNGLSADLTTIARILKSQRVGGETGAAVAECPSSTLYILKKGGKIIALKSVTLNLHTERHGHLLADAGLTESSTSETTDNTQKNLFLMPAVRLLATMHNHNENEC